MASWDVALAELRAKHPEWYIWYVPKARGKPVWCAGRPSNMIATFEAQSADELDEDLTDTAEADASFRGNGTVRPPRRA